MKIVRLPERKYGIVHLGLLRAWGICIGRHAIEIRTSWLSDIRWAIKRRIRGFEQ